MKAVRIALKTGELAPEADAPPALDIIARPARAILPEFEKTECEPEFELVAEAAPDTEQGRTSRSTLTKRTTSRSNTDPEVDSTDEQIASESTLGSKRTSEPIEPSLIARPDDKCGNDTGRDISDNDGGGHRCL